MPLILAVEPDPRQASRLAVVLRGRRNTDVVMATSAETALAAMDGRVPDVLLTSQLLSPQDEQRLADWLKDLGPMAGHVQALTIPILATPGKAEAQRGLLAGLRRRADNPGSNGCEPKIFAEHVATYLEQGRAERMEMEAVAPAAMVPDPVTPEPVIPEPGMPDTVIDDSVMADTVMLQAVMPQPAAPTVEATAAAEEEGAWLLTQTVEATPAIEEPVAEEVDTAPIVQLTPAYELPPEVVQEPPVTDRSEPQVLMMPPEVIPLQSLEVVFLPPEIVTVRDDGWDALRYSARHDSDTAVMPRPAAPILPDVPASPLVVASSDAPPVMNEWGLFDPSKCGFEALLDKLDEITEDERRAQDVDTHVRVVTHY